MVGEVKQPVTKLISQSIQWGSLQKYETISNEIQCGSLFEYETKLICNKINIRKHSEVSVS
jgi:hypothetical protein